MSSIARLAGCAALCAALLVPAAGASAKGAAAPKRAATPIGQAVSIGADHWGAIPCGGDVTLRSGQRRGAGVDRTADAWVTFSTPTGDNDLTAPASTYTDCVISLGRSRWPTRASMTADWDVLCMTVAHEVGHLLGHAHEDRPGSLMAPVFRDYSAEPRGCRTKRPR